MVPCLSNKKQKLPSLHFGTMLVVPNKKQSAIHYSVPQCSIRTAMTATKECRWHFRRAPTCANVCEWLLTAIHYRVVIKYNEPPRLAGICNEVILNVTSPLWDWGPPHAIYGYWQNNGEPCCAHKLYGGSSPNLATLLACLPSILWISLQKGG